MAAAAALPRTAGADVGYLKEPVACWGPGLDWRAAERRPSGGHFPAAEEPELLAGELREFFRPLR